MPDSGPRPNGGGGGAKAVADASAAASQTPPFVKVLSQPLTLPCGRTMPNRLTKAPMEEFMAQFGGSAPTPQLLKLYRRWAEGGWGMLITGNVAVDRRNLGFPFDISPPAPPYDEDTLKRFRRYADVTSGRASGLAEGQRPLAVVQLVHAGRQSMRGMGRWPWKPSLAPSAVPMRTMGQNAVARALDNVLWGVPKEMSVEDIKHMVHLFASAAELCHKTGFDGVEVHASHGYQVAAFLSPKTNLRKDEYGGDAKRRARLLMEIVEETRKRVPRDFIVGVKLNSADYVQGGLTEDDALQNVKWLAESRMVDFVEISGGNYENPSFMTDNFDAEEELRKLNGGAAANGAVAKGSAKNGDAANTSSAKRPPGTSARSAAREAFFQNFARRCREALGPAGSTSAGAAPSSSEGMALILTGGLRTRAGMASALLSGSVDAVGIGRPACIYPRLPEVVLDANVADEDEARASPTPYRVPESWLAATFSKLKLAGAGWATLWHTSMLHYVSHDLPVNLDAGLVDVLAVMSAPGLLLDSRTGKLSPLAPLGAILSLLSAIVVLVARRS